MWKLEKGSRISGLKTCTKEKSVFVRQLGGRMNKFLLALVLIFTSGLSHSMSFVYDGFECAQSQSPSTIPKQSRFEVIEDFGNGTYRILFTGGLPLFSNTTGPCVGDAFGVETFDPSEGIAIKKTDAQAMAHFTGTDLTVTLATLNSYGEGGVLGDTLIMSSLVIPQIFTWIFEFIPETTTFKLIRNFEYDGTIKILGSLTPSPGKVIENIIMHAPTTGSPPSVIEYKLE